MLNTSSPLNSSTTQASRSNHRILLRLEIDGDLRFISHRDTMRMLTRALTRSGLPVAYTRGYNPRIKLSLPLPRSVGMASDDDPVILELTEQWSPSRVSATLGPQLPSGARLVDVIPLPDEYKPQLVSVTYEVELDPQTVNDLAEAIERFLSASSVMVARHDEKGNLKAEHDIRPFVAELSLHKDRLRFATVFHDGRTASPKDLAAALALPWEQLRHKIRRRRTIVPLPCSIANGGST